MLQHKKLYDSLSLLFYNLVEPLYSEYLNEYDQIKKQWINEEIGRQKHQLAIQGNFGLKFMELCDREKEIDATAEIIRKKIDQFLGSDQLSTYLFLYGHVDQANNISGRESLLDSILCEIIYLAAIRTGKSQLIRKAKKYRIM